MTQTHTQGSSGPASKARGNNSGTNHRTIMAISNKTEFRIKLRSATIGDASATCCVQGMKKQGMKRCQTQQQLATCRACRAKEAQSHKCCVCHSECSNKAHRADNQTQQGPLLCLPSNMEPARKRARDKSEQADRAVTVLSDE